MISFQLNGEEVSVDVPPDTPLLWVIREELGLTGTKFGCGKGLCGACTIHMDGQATRTCVLPVVAATGRQVTTIEGLSKEGPTKLQKAWIEHGVPQCGYCQSGQIMQASSLLNNTKKPTDEEIDQAMSGNICRCGTYCKIKAAIKSAAEVQTGVSS
ncbi:MAG: (2Fe-2S)-binding protein [Bdellovibrionales bacterium]|nr:(2Fe-2S)-binding protein [Bdellovibrionales bacterium]